MRRERLFLWLSLVANVLLLLAFIGFLGKWKLREIELVRERRNGEELIHRLKEAEFTAKSRATNKPALSDAEVLELARLRNEVTRLRNEQRSAAVTNSIAARRPPALAPASPPSPPPVTKLTSTVTAQVPLGHALAVGGWAGQEPGQRVIGFITPVTVSEAGSITPAPVAGAPGQVLLETHLLTIPDRLLDRLGLQDLRTDQASSQASAGLDAARLAALLKLAEQETGVSILSAPRVLTLSGRAAQVSVTQAQPDGTQTGPVINLTPTLDATGTSVRLDVGLELNLPPRSTHGR